MICQRTGYCCISMDVVVIISEGDGKFGVYGKPANAQCPNLTFDEKGGASCAVHEELWFKTTPCHSYQNSDIDPDFVPKRGKPCMLGPMARTRHDLVQLGKSSVELERYEDFKEEGWG